MNSGSTRHILACITPHGFGHAAQMCNVLTALQENCEAFRLTLMCNTPEDVLMQWISIPFTQIPMHHDPGMIMANALIIQAEASLRAHQKIIAQCPEIIEGNLKLFQVLQPDIILGNIPYHIPPAAKKAGIPCINICSLNWADILTAYCWQHEETAEVVNNIKQAYSTATHTITMEAGMPMTWLQPQSRTNPIYRKGKADNAGLKQQLGLNPDQRVVLISMGGIDTVLPIDRWPVIEDTFWLVERGHRYNHDNVINLDKLPLAFTDVACSCDAMIIKVGYNSMIEAASNAIPLLYIPRNDWPEEPYLIDWFDQYGHGEPLRNEAFDRGDIELALRRLWSKHAKICPIDTGNKQVAELIKPYLL